MKVGITALVEEDLWQKLTALARKNGRSLSGEARYALVQYVRGCDNDSKGQIEGQLDIDSMKEEQ